MLELEERALQHRHRINELRRRVVMKEKSLRQLEDHIANPDFGLEDRDDELVTIKQQSKTLNNKCLKQLTTIDTWGGGGGVIPWIQKR